MSTVGPGPEKFPSVKARALTEADALRELRRQSRVIVAGAAALCVAAIAGIWLLFAAQSRTNAELAAQQAKLDARFEMATKAVAALHADLREDILLKSRRFEELRMRLLKDAEEFYTDLRQALEGQTDSKSRRQLAATCFQLADVKESAGDDSRALALHRQGLAIRRELAAKPGADVETQLDVVHSQGAVARLLFATGNERDGADTLHEQHELAAALAAKSPTPSVRSVLATSLYRGARFIRDTGNTAEALAWTNQAVTLLRRLADDNPADAEIHFGLADALLTMEYLQWDQGHWAEKLAALEEARNVLQRLADAAPAVALYRERLATTCNNIGATLFELGRPADALRVLAQGRVISQQLADSTPEVSQYRVLFAYVEFNIGRAARELGKQGEATLAFDRARTTLQKLAAEIPADPEVQYMLGCCSDELGEMLRRMGIMAGAMEAFQAARSVLQKVADSHHELCLPQAELASARERIGLSLSALGSNHEAVAACQEAAAIRQRLSDSRPTFACLRSELAATLSTLGMVLRRAGRPVEAAAAFRRAVVLMESLPEPRPRDHYDLARAHAQIASIASEPGSRINADEGAADATQAVAALKAALTAGFGSGRLSTDADLDALRGRADFQRLLKHPDGAAKVPAAATPAQMK
jgi:tetratricopeptide (TPR) repeat protein